MTIFSRKESSKSLTVSLVRAERDEKWTIFGIDSDVDIRDVSLGRGTLERRRDMSVENSSVFSELANRAKVYFVAASGASPRHKVVMDEGGRAIGVGMNSENSNPNSRSVGMDNMSR